MTVTISLATLDAAREMFEHRGSSGCEGTAMIASDGVATRLVAQSRQLGRHAAFIKWRELRSSEWGDEVP